MPILTTILLSSMALFVSFITGTRMPTDVQRALFFEVFDTRTNAYRALPRVPWRNLEMDNPTRGW